MIHCETGTRSYLIRRHAREVILNPIYDIFELGYEFCRAAVSTVSITKYILCQRDLCGQTTTDARECKRTRMNSVPSEP